MMNKFDYQNGIIFMMTSQCVVFLATLFDSIILDIVDEVFYNKTARLLDHVRFSVWCWELTPGRDVN